MCENRKYAVFECLEGMTEGQRLIAKIETNSYYPPAYREVVTFCDCELSQKITQSAQGIIAELQEELLISPLNTDLL